VAAARSWGSRAARAGRPFVGPGATDQEIRVALHVEWGDRRICGTKNFVYIADGLAPAIWINGDATAFELGVPTFQGDTLIATVRELLEIPLPQGAEQ